MATQRVLLLTIGGVLAESVWKDIRRWGSARTVTQDGEWSSADWPVRTRNDIDAFVEKIHSCGLTPPVLYRSEHVDCWSMGDVYQEALVKKNPEYCQRLNTTNHEVIATWVSSTEQIVPDRDAVHEVSWLYNRLNDAIAAWGDFAEHRLIILIRSVVGGSWTDDEITDSLKVIPSWWTRTEQPHRR